MKQSTEIYPQTVLRFKGFKQEFIGEFRITNEGKILKFTPINSNNGRIFSFHQEWNDFNEFTREVFQRDFRELIKATVVEKLPRLKQFNASINDNMFSLSISIHPLDDSELIVSLFEINEDREEIHPGSIFQDESSALIEIIKKHPLPFSIFDKKGYFLEGNEKYRDLFGAKPPSDYTFLDDPIAKQEPWWDEGINDLKKGKNFQTPALWYDAHLVDEKIPSKRICIMTEIMPIKNDDGEIQNYIQVTRDITEKEIAKEKLIESEKKYEHLFNTAPMAVWLVDSRGIIVDCNEAMNDLLAIFKKEDLIGKRFSDVFKMFLSEGDSKFGELTHVFKERFKRLVKGEPRKTPFIINVNRGDGKPLWLSIESTVVELGKEKYFQSFIRDITPQQLAIKELEKERNTLKNIIELNPYAMQIFDNNGNNLFCNEALEKMFLSVPRPEYNFFEDPLHIKSGAAEAFRRVIKDGEILRAPENWYDPHDQNPELPSKLICHNATCFPIFDFKGNVEKVIAMYEDITDRKMAEQKLKELKDELEKRVKERTFILEQSQETYQKAYNRANCFKGLFTHDINNMVQAIGNAIELCKKKYLKNQNFDDILEYYDLIERQLNRGRKMIQNIQNLSDIELSEMATKPIKIKDTLEQAIEFTYNNFREELLEIRSQIIIKKDQSVLANVLLGDVFENILINAVNYTKRNPKIIEIIVSESIEEDEEFIQIEFTDNGIGIPDSEKEKIFTSDSSKNHSKGMGLGLSHISRLISLWKGEIWVEDKVKGDHTRGSNFILKLIKSN